MIAYKGTPNMLKNGNWRNKWSKTSIYISKYAYISNDADTSMIAYKYAYISMIAFKITPKCFWRAADETSEERTSFNLSKNNMLI